MALSEPSKSFVVSQSTTISVPISPIAVGELKKGFYVLLKGFPCVITEILFSKTGKHGSMKGRIVGSDVLTGRKYTWVGPNSTSMENFTLDRREYTVIDTIIAEEVSAVDYIDDQNVVHRIDVNPSMARTIKALLDKDDVIVIIKIIRAPSRQKNNDEPTTLQMVESCHATKEN